MSRKAKRVSSAWIGRQVETICHLEHISIISELILCSFVNRPIVLPIHMKQHRYNIKVEWTGNKGQGTLDYTSYNRSHSISGKVKYEEILASSDPAFLGDKSRYNPEDLFLSSISSCHMLWYLHLRAVNKIVVTGYIDHAEGVMEETANGSGRFVEVTLHPQVTIVNEADQQKAHELHAETNRMCFIANSCNFPIGHPSTIFIKGLEA